MAAGPRAQPRAPGDAAARALIASLAAGLPLLFALAQVSPELTWGEPARLARGAIVHGDAVSALAGGWFGLWTWLPLGSLALRVAVGSATAVALAAAAVAIAVERVVAAQGARAEVAAGVGVAVAWLGVAWPDGWEAAVAPSDAALSLGLTALALERLVRLELAWPSYDLRPLGAVGVVIGLAACHAPALAAALTVATLPTALRVGRVGAGGAVGRAAVMAAPGVVTAVAFGAADHPLALEPPGALVESLAGLALVALAGAWLLHRGGLRRVAVTAATLALALGLATRIGVGAPCLAVPLGVLASGVAGALLAAPRRSGLRSAVALSLALLALLALRERSLAASPDGPALTPQLADASLSPTPTRAVLVVGDSLGDVLAATRAEQHDRPDLVLLSRRRLHDRVAVHALSRAHPELTVLLRGYLLEGELPRVALQSLAGRRPIRLELDATSDPELYATLVADGLLHLVLPSEATASDARRGASEQESFYEALDLESLAPGLPATLRDYLEGRARADALYYLALGDREGAVTAIERGELLHGPPAYYGALRTAMAESELGPVDVAPFLSPARAPD